MLETEAHHDISNFDEDSCTLDDKYRYIQVFYAVVCDPIRQWSVEPGYNEQCLTNGID